MAKAPFTRSSAWLDRVFPTLANQSLSTVPEPRYHMDMSTSANRIRPWRHVWLLALLTTACQEPPQETQTVPQDQSLTMRDQLLLVSAKVALPPEGTMPADLPAAGSAGANLLQQYCVSCHALPHPGTHSATDWPAVVRRMWLRMGKLNEQFTVPEPTSGERVALLQYLIANAFTVNEASLPAGPNREFFTTTCSQCHALPDPRQHSPEDWIAVVRRMTDHMQEMLGESLAPADISRIASYLSQASGA